MREGGVCRLDGMDRYNGHILIETTTTNILDLNGKLSFYYVRSMDHLCCMNPKYQCIDETKNYNKMYWLDSSQDVMTPNISPIPSLKCKVMSKYCKATHFV